MTTDPRVKNLRDAQRRLRSALIANADRLDKPFTDDPDKNPWDTFVRPAMRELKAAVDAIAAMPAAPVAAPPTGQAGLVLTESERTMLAYALDQAQEKIWSEGGFTDEDQAAVTSLRRLAAETPGPETQGVRHAPGTAILCPDCRAKGYSVCMASGEQRPETQAPAEIECANCWRVVENRSTPNMGGPSRDNWVHVPGGFTPCFPQRGADSPRAEPELTVVPQPEIVHACPPDGSGLTPCCGRTPFELPLTDRISSEVPVTCTTTPAVVAEPGKEA